MDRTTRNDTRTNTLATRVAAGAAAAAASGSAFAIDTASIITEIDAAKTAGMAVLGAMILAGLAFKAWKLLKRA